jgi:hypothetical protein
MSEESNRPNQTNRPERTNRPNPNNGPQNNQRPSNRNPNANRTNTNRQNNRNPNINNSKINNRKNDQYQQNDKPVDKQGSRFPKRPGSNQPNNQQRRQHHGGARKDLSTLEILLNKHDMYLTSLNDARRKYFEYFEYEDGRQRERYRRNYEIALINLRKFENDIESDADRIAIKNRFNPYKDDLEYSHFIQETQYTYNDLGQFNEEDFKEPHILISQKTDDFKNDTEESNGSYDDYKKYKGL